jgi:hypothetical protein
MRGNATAHRANTYMHALAQAFGERVIDKSKIVTFINGAS